MCPFIPKTDESRVRPPIAGQALVTPVTDCDFSRDSYVDNAEGYVLTTALMPGYGTTTPIRRIECTRKLRRSEPKTWRIFLQRSS